MQARVLGLIDDAHTSPAELLEHAIVRNRSPDEVGFGGPDLLGHQFARNFQGRRIEELFGSLLLCQQRFHFPAQRFIPTAGAFEEFRAAALVQFQRLLNHFFYSLPTSWLHSVASPNSRKSHSLANFQSRFTVSVEMRNTSAISSILRPPKNFSSTTLLFLASSAARAFNASSSATRSGSGSLNTAGASSNEM